MARAVSNSNFLAKQFTLANFEGKWLHHLGRPSLTGIWFVYGKSGAGKTTYCLQLAKYLASFDKRIAYNSLEQGVSPSLQAAWRRGNMAEVGRKIILLDREELDALRLRLNKRQSPEIVFIDSVAYLQNSVDDILSLRYEYPSKLFVLLGQEKDGEAFGAKQIRIKHDADIKIRLVGGIAKCETRYETEDGYGGADLVVYEKRKKKFYAEID